jgi:hypothetical protein
VLEEILKLKQGLQFEAAFLDLRDQKRVSKISIMLSEKPENIIGLLRYHEDDNSIEKISDGDCEVELRNGFDVLDATVFSSILVVSR